MNSKAIIELSKLAERYSQDKSDETNSLIAACLYSLCGALSAGTQVLLLISINNAQFLQSVVNAIDYVEWVDKA
jgi:hypothetical protein